MTGNGVQVLVVGAGPAGLLLAAELTRRNVPCLLIDGRDAPQTWDRATVLHARSLEIFEALGLEDRVLAEGVRTRGARFHSDGDVLGVLDFGASGGTYPFDIGLSEEVTERVLTELLEAHGGAVTRSTSLVGLVPGDDGATATLETDGQRREVVAQWVVGCDGLHSAVREAAGIDFPGTAIDRQWAVFDATVEGWQGDYDFVAVHLDVPPVILTPLPGRRWRAYVRPSSETSDLVAEASAVIGRYQPDATIVDVENPIRFWCHSRIADRYRAGRILLAGDAAHDVHARGGPRDEHRHPGRVQPRVEAGARVPRGGGARSARHLRDRAAARRRDRRLLRCRHRGRARPHRPDRARPRDAELRRTFADPFTAHHESAATAEVDRSYPASRAVGAHAGAMAPPGRRLPDTAPVEPVDAPAQPLHHLTHRPGLTLLAIGGPAAEPERMQGLLAELGPLAGGAVDAVVALSAHPGGPNVGRIDESVAAQLGVVDLTVLVVRPDRYVGFRDDRADPSAVRAYLSGLIAT